MTAYLTTDALIALFTLTAMEIVLGIDNIVFIAILVGKLPKAQQAQARTLGIAFALITRLALLFSITWVMGLTAPLFEVLGRAVSGRDLILLVGGMFLIFKATGELHERVIHGAGAGEIITGESAAGARRGTKHAALGPVVLQIALLDIIFSLDSVITAVGMAQELWIMVAAVIVAVGVMLLASGAISAFIERHPTLKVLALSFLILIGVMLLLEGTGKHVDKGYIYFAMAFAVAIEMMNLRIRSKAGGKAH